MGQLWQWKGAPDEDDPIPPCLIILLERFESKDPVPGASGEHWIVQKWPADDDAWERWEWCDMPFEDDNMVLLSECP